MRTNELLPRLILSHAIRKENSNLRYLPSEWPEKPTFTVARPLVDVPARVNSILFL